MHPANRWKSVSCLGGLDASLQLNSPEAYDDE